MRLLGFAHRLKDRAQLLLQLRLHVYNVSLKWDKHHIAILHLLCNPVIRYEWLRMPPR